MIFLISVSLIAAVKVLHPKDLRDHLIGLVDYKYVSNTFKSETSKLPIATLMLSANAVLIYALLIFQLKSFYKYQLIENASPFIEYLCITGILFVFYVTKRLVVSLTGFFFNDYLTCRRINADVSAVYRSFGLLLILLTLYIQYGAYLNYEVLVGTVILSTIFAIYQEMRGVLIAFSNKVSPFYIILYLCTLEILPLIILLKYLSVNF